MPPKRKKRKVAAKKKGGGGGGAAGNGREGKVPSLATHNPSSSGCHVLRLFNQVRLEVQHKKMIPFFSISHLPPFTGAAAEPPPTLDQANCVVCLEVFVVDEKGCFPVVRLPCTPNTVIHFFPCAPKSHPYPAC